MAFAQEKKTFVAFSMKAAQARVREAIRQGLDFRQKPTDFFYLGGMTKPRAVVLDPLGQDWILIGERDPQGPLLTLDDWVTALRARFLHAERDPGVTIDPRCRKSAVDRADCATATVQDVRFFAGIEDTRFGQVCYEADWLMKRIGMDLENVPVKSLLTYYDLSVQEHRKRGGGRLKVGSRFWFYPIASRVNVLSDLILLEKLQIGVFTEVLYAELNDQPVSDLTRFEHGPSEGFARSFSENYDALAEKLRELDTLRGLTRLAALAKGLTQVGATPLIDFYLTAYPVERTTTPTEASVLTARDTDVGFSISGGVTLAALATRLQKGDVSALQELVLRSRPSAEKVSWLFETEMRDGQLAIQLPAPSNPVEALYELHTQAVFLYSQKRYAAALEYMEKFVQMDPSVAQGWVTRGAALNSLGRHTDALDSYNRAIAIQASDPVTWYDVAVALSDLGRDTEALESYDKAVKIDPTFLRAVYDKARLLNRIGRPMDALAALDTLIDKLPDEPENWVEKGYSLSFLGRYEEAIQLFDKAITLRPRFALAWSNKGNALLELGNRERGETIAASGEPYKEGFGYYAEALKALSKALDIDPDEPGALWGTGSTLASTGRKKEAKWYFERFTQVAPSSMKEQVNRAKRILDHL
jgi:tetratricopeptide (TPR) repeat protein